ncbi:hypothetical protein BVRB_5g110130 [Beta vulgaris subsp. vulgaris]|uniref:Uncharacterized protein n=1 Tax=Beta vulgaris subsp. vulgaris TaxID=3555 RepID=A0A0J8CGM3_BETVV|nr:hypothetical protein BVRB_5g110130 [Beta vulgaris subsp. vulgaris]
MRKRLTAKQRVQEQLKLKVSKGDIKVPRAPKTSKAGLEFAADMALEASEIADREAVGRLQEAFRKIYPQADWSSVETEYNASVGAAFHEGNDSDPELEVDDAIARGDLLGEDAQQIEDPLAAGTPVAQEEEVHEENSGNQEVSSDNSSSESGDDEVVSETLDSDTSSISP